jgi:uncharacterized protein involved in exopolysaccharide biosynthesis
MTSPIEQQVRTVDLTRTARTIVGYRRWLLVPLVLAVAVALAAYFVLPRRFTAITTFVPEESAGASRLPEGLGALASDIGLQLSSGPVTSAQFYADVLMSRPVLERTLRHDYAAARAGADSVSLLALLGSRGRTTRDSLERAARKLGKRMRVIVDQRTNIVRIEVSLGNPEVAAAVANDLVSQLDTFNLTTRQSRARLRRVFIEQRLAEEKSALSAAENRLAEFYDRNRTWQQSSELRLQEAQHQRELTLRQQVFLGLSQDFEEARIDEVNDAPAISVIAPAVPPARKSFPRLGLLLGFALAAGGAIGALGVWYRSAIDAERSPLTPSA